jgi:hypothetical protein
VIDRVNGCGKVGGGFGIKSESLRFKIASMDGQPRRAGLGPATPHPFCCIRSGRLRRDRFTLPAYYRAVSADR